MAGTPTEIELEKRLTQLNQLMGPYIPSHDTWTPADEALYNPANLIGVPIDEAQALQFKAIKYAFTRQYTYNTFYHRYCDKCRFTPDDIKTNGDLEKVPLIPDVTFKYHPEGEEFAHWIASLYTGELPTIVLKSTNPTLDDVIDAFNAAGLVVAYSTGTSGLHSVIPRDKRTFYAWQYSAAKMGNTLHDGLGVDHTLSLFPKPTNANLGAARATEISEILTKDSSYALDVKITADITARGMTEQQQQESAQQATQEMMSKVLQNGIEWLYRYEKTTDKISVLTPPVLLVACMDILEGQGKHFEFGERASIITVGGWKTRENERIPLEYFRKRVEEMFGIPETNMMDAYGMIEMNAQMLTCPEGHYYHLPNTHLKPLVLDSDLEPVGYGETGRFAFLDALAGSYPGFIMSGDKVRLLEHCPTCDRPGPVLDRMIDRISSEEMRGCAAQVRAALEQDIRGG